jgi:hypothetical protein
MTIISFTSPRQVRAAWPALSLAIFVALGYFLIALNVLTVGDLKLTETPSAVVYVAAICYFVGGWVILSRSQALLVSGAMINAMMTLLFYGLHPSILTTPFFTAELAAAIAQLLLEVLLVMLIVVRWLRPLRANR